MTSKERALRAIHFNTPDRLPILIFNADFAESDIIVCDVVDHFSGENHDTSEFGFVWDSRDDTMGQPRESLIQQWADFDNYRFPDAGRSDRFQEAFRRMETYGRDKYYVAGLSLSGFTVMTFLRGFEDTLCDLYTEPEMLAKLADGVFGFEEEVIRLTSGKGFSAVAFFDDWGTQDRLIIGHEQWCTFFKPRYKRQFDLCHELGMDVYFHCCGYIWDIIPDLIEIGVDILNISQPNLFDLTKLGQTFGGKVCFLCPVSYQTTSLTGTREDIFRDAKELYEKLGSSRGGLIGYIEEYSSLGMSRENYEACKEAFLSCGGAKG